MERICFIARHLAAVSRFPGDVMDMPTVEPATSRTKTTVVSNLLCTPVYRGSEEKKSICCKRHI